MSIDFSKLIEFHLDKNYFDIQLDENTRIEYEEGFVCIWQNSDEYVEEEYNKEELVFLDNEEILKNALEFSKEWRKQHPRIKITNKD